MDRCEVLMRGTEDRFESIGEVLDSMKAIRHLHRIWCALIEARLIGPRAVTGHDAHFRMGPEPSGHGISQAILSYINRAVAL
jgi:hypothetical protein